MNQQENQAMAYWQIGRALRHIKMAPRDKFVLMAVAYFTDKDKSEGSYPTVKTLTDMVCMDRRTVMRALRELEAGDYLVHQDADTKTGRTWALGPAYWAGMPGGDNLTRGGTATPEGGRIDPPRGGELPPELGNKQNKVKEQTPPTPPKGGTAVHFEAWWKLYPRGEEKKQAKEVWKRKHLDDKADEIIEHTRKWNEEIHQGTRDPKYIPYGVRYLRNERWTDEHKSIQEAYHGQADQRLSAYERDRRANDAWLEQELACSAGGAGAGRGAPQASDAPALDGDAGDLREPLAGELWSEPERDLDPSTGTVDHRADQARRR